MSKKTMELYDYRNGLYVEFDGNPLNLFYGNFKFVKSEITDEMKSQNKELDENVSNNVNK